MAIIYGVAATVAIMLASIFAGLVVEDFCSKRGMSDKKSFMMSLIGFFVTFGILLIAYKLIF